MFPRRIAIASVALLASLACAAPSAENAPPRPGRGGRMRQQQAGAANAAGANAGAANAAAAKPPAAAARPAARAPMATAANGAAATTTANPEDATVAGDLIILTNGQRLAGTVDDSVAGTDDKIAIRLAEGGVIRIRRDLVRQQERGYDSRRTALKDGDFSAALDLAKWCLTKDKKPEAMAALELALQWAANAPSGDAVLEAKAMYAALVDELKSAEAALPLYQDYRAKGGTDADTLARVAQLEEAIKQYHAQDQQAAQPETSAVATTHADQLESRTWDSELPAYTNPVEVKHEDIDTVEGKNRVLDITFKGDPQHKGGPVDKAAIKRAMPAAALGDRTVLSLYVRNLGQKPVSLTLGVKTGDWVFHESAKQSVAVGDAWKLLQFDLGANTFKSVATAWANNGTIANLDQIKEIQFLIYNGQSEGHLQFDQIQFVSPVH